MQIRISLPISISFKKMKHPFFLIRFGKRLDDKLPVKKNTERKKDKRRKKEKKIRIENKPS